MRARKPERPGLFERVQGAVTDALPTMPSLDFTSDAEISVYLVHYGAGADEYDILFDFDLFVAETHKGFLVRPKLVLWSGRNDIQRSIFARRLRHAFAEQFEQVRAELAAERQSSWRIPSIWDIGGLVFAGGASVLSTIFLMLATSIGGRAVEEVRAFLADSIVGRAFSGKPARVALEEKIREKQVAIDEGLVRMDIKIHRDLWVHAHRDGSAGSMKGIDFGAWPLPEFVRAQMALSR